MIIHSAQTSRTAPRPLQDKVALVTGSTGGIGPGMARAFTAAGAAVVLDGFGGPEEIRGTVSGLAEFGVEALHAAADMSRPDEDGRTAH